MDAVPQIRGRSRVRKPLEVASPPGSGEARLRRALDTALEDQQQLRNLVDTAPVLIARLDREERYRFVNAAYARRFGLTPDRLVARSVGDVIGDEAHAVLRPHLEAALAGRRVECEISVPYRDLACASSACASRRSVIATAASAASSPCSATSPSDAAPSVRCTSASAASRRSRKTRRTSSPASTTSCVTCT